MKMMIIFSLMVFAALVLSTPAYAAPIINDVTFDPSSNLQINESVVIRVNCTDDVNPILNVYAQVVGEDGLTIPNPYFTLQGGLFTTTLNSFLFNNRPNNFLVNLTCKNSNSDSYNYVTNFSVSNFSSGINSISPGTIYLGDSNPITVNLLVKKNNNPLIDGVSFAITLNGTIVQAKGISYLPGSGWNLYLDRPSASGAYNLKVTAFYDRFNSTDSALIAVRDPVQFSIMSIDRTWVNPNDTIILQIQASDRDNPIGINSGNLAVQVGTTQANILSITPMSNYFNVAVQMPNIPSGVYTLTALLSYNGYNYPGISTVYYITPISGEITDDSGKGISVILRFLSGGIEKLKIYTDSNGDYSGSLPSGTYDLEVTFPQSTLYLESTTINSFNDPIKYFYSSDDLVPGIRNAGLFSYGIGLAYYQANIEAKYLEKNVINDNNIIVLKCSNWNSGRKICNDDWSEIGGNIDTIRNVVTLNTTSLSAFVIGERKSINVNYNLDSDNYYVSSPIKVNGIVKDSDGNVIPNATVNVKIKNFGTNAKTYSDSNGAFVIELKAPDQEGDYVLSLGAEKSPYISFNDSKSFQTLKSRTVEIAVPDTIKLKQGQNLTQEISIINTGQADLLNLSIFLSGIPSSYFNLTNFIDKLGRNEEDKIYAYFSIPEDAGIQTYSITLRVSNGEMSQEKIFGLTVVDKNSTISEATTAPSGQFILPKIDNNIVYLIVFAIACFSLAIFLKKTKIRKSKRNDITGFLSNVKDSLGNRKSSAAEKGSSNYRELILSQFPNSKDKDDYGKNN
jgi:hypothetical protein